MLIQTIMAFVLVGGFGAVTRQGGPVLPGVPISQEHHHHLVLENSFVKAYEVEVAPHEATLMHQHLHDYVYVVFGDDDLTNAVAGKPEVRLKQTDLSVNFSPGPFAHVAANNAEVPFRNITIELLRSQGEVKKYYPTITEALAKATPGQNGAREATVLETEGVRVVAVGIPQGSNWSPPPDGRDRLVIKIDKIRDPGPRENNAPFPAGMLNWVSAGAVSGKLNARGRDIRLMVLEFKGTATK